MKLGAIGVFFSFISLNSLASDARSYLLVPVSTSLAEFRYASSETVTPSQPREVRIENQTTSMKLTHYYDLFGTLGAIQVMAPYTRLNRHATTDSAESGMSDSSIVFGLGLYNTPALTRETYEKFNKNGLSAAGAITLFGATGAYDKTKLLNTGSHRNAQKFEIQTAWRNDGLILELIGGFSQYGSNREYLVNNVVEQKKLYHAETHVSVNLTPQFWISLDTFFASGGELVLNGRNMHNPQRSMSGGLVAGYAPSRNQLVKIIYQNTVDKSSASTGLEGLAVSYTHVF